MVTLDDDGDANPEKNDGEAMDMVPLHGRLTLDSLFNFPESVQGGS